METLPYELANDILKNNLKAMFVCRRWYDLIINLPEYIKCKQLSVSLRSDPVQMENYKMIMNRYYQPTIKNILSIIGKDRLTNSQVLLFPGGAKIIIYSTMYQFYITVCLDFIRLRLFAKDQKIKSGIIKSLESLRFLLKTYGNDILIITSFSADVVTEIISMIVENDPLIVISP